MRDDRFLQVMQIVLRSQDVNLSTHWGSSADFLGYAPVLIALAESLAVTNPSAERSRLASAKADNETELLLHIIGLILDRERSKFSEQLFLKLQAHQSVEDDAIVSKAKLYLPTEQATRVIAYLQGGDALVSPPPADLPSSVRSIYEDAAEQFTADHPFVRARQFASVIFGDYVRALVATSLEAAAALRRVPLPDADTVGPFFATFVKVMCLDEQIPEALVEPLLRSWAQEVELAGDDDGAAMVTLVEDLHEVRFIRSSAAGGARRDEMVFSIATPSGALQLKGPLRNVLLVTDQGVILGTRAEPLSIGPDVIVVADEVDIQAEVLNIAWPEAGARVAISGRSLTANHLSQVEAPDRDSFSLYFSDPPPKLQAYKKVLDGGSFAIPYSDYIALRAVLTSFYSSVHFSGLSVTRERIDNEIVRGALDRVRIMQHLSDTKVISTSGDWYVLDTGALGNIGISLTDVKSGAPSSAVLKFLSECRSS